MTLKLILSFVIGFAVSALVDSAHISDKPRRIMRQKAGSVHEMAKREDAKHGLATLCIGGGMGVATVWEKC